MINSEWMSSCTWSERNGEDWTFFKKKYPGELYITRGHQMRMLCARYTVILHLKMCESKLFKEWQLTRLPGFLKDTTNRFFQQKTLFNGFSPPTFEESCATKICINPLPFLFVIPIFGQLFIPSRNDLLLLNYKLFICELNTKNTLASGNSFEFIL